MWAWLCGKEPREGSPPPSLTAGACWLEELATRARVADALRESAERRKRVEKVAKAALKLRRMRRPNAAVHGRSAYYLGPYDCESECYPTEKAAAALFAQDLRLEITPEFDVVLLDHIYRGGEACMIKVYAVPI